MHDLRMGLMVSMLSMGMLIAVLIMAMVGLVPFGSKVLIILALLGLGVIWGSKLIDDHEKDHRAYKDYYHKSGAEEMRQTVRMWQDDWAQGNYRYCDQAKLNARLFYSIDKFKAVFCSQPYMPGDDAMVVEFLDAMQEEINKCNRISNDNPGRYAAEYRIAEAIWHLK